MGILGGSWTITAPWDIPIKYSMSYMAMDEYIDVGLIMRLGLGEVGDFNDKSKLGYCKSPVHMFFHLPSVSKNLNVIRFSPLK